MPPLPLSPAELHHDPERLLEPLEVLAALYPPGAVPEKHHYYKLTRTGTSVRGTGQRVILGCTQTPKGRVSSARQVLAFKAKLDEIAGRKLAKRRAHAGGAGGSLHGSGRGDASSPRPGARRFAKDLRDAIEGRGGPGFARCDGHQVGTYPRLAEGRGLRGASGGRGGSRDHQDGGPGECMDAQLGAVGERRPPAPAL